MLHQIKSLAYLELVNFFGINVMRNTKEKDKKKIALAVVVIAVILMFSAYIGVFCYGLIVLGMAHVIPLLLVSSSSMLIMMFGFFTAGRIVFKRNGYDIIASLPLSQAAIVISRFIRFYVENILIMAVVALPGTIVYGVCVRPSALFYVYAVVGLMLIPLIPMSIDVIVGAIITAIASRMKNKSIVEAVLSVALVVGIMALTARGTGISGDINVDMIKEMLESAVSSLKGMYIPADWLSAAMVEYDAVKFLMFAGLSVSVCAVTAALVSFRFHEVCRRLFGTSAKHNYRMRSLKQASVLNTLCKRELKRYFSSGIYVTNTIIGDIMGVVAAVAIFVIGTDVLAGKIPFELDIAGVLPIAVAAMFNIMSITCVSISLEGKNWWIVKSLPVSAKMIFDAKILAAFMVKLPFYLVAEVFMLLSCTKGIGDVLWIIVAPLVGTAFSLVFGIKINLAMPLMKWDNEVEVIKQSASAVVGGLGGALFLIVCALAVAAVPRALSSIVKVAVIVVILGVTGFLYVRNSRVNLQEIE